VSRIAAGIITYPIKPERVEYLEYGIERFQRYAKATRHGLTLFVSCEADERGNVDAVRHVCESRGVGFFLNEGTPCMGANQNNAMHIAFEMLRVNYLLLLIDDGFPLGPIDLSGHVDFLNANPEIDILRFHWSGRDGACPAFTDRGDGYNQVDPAGLRFYDDSPHIRRCYYVEHFGQHIEKTPAEAGMVEHATCESLKRGGANIVATKEFRFGKGGLVSAVR
jgi:hypothetical protein